VVLYALPKVPAGSVVVETASSATPVPVRETDCGLPEASSVNARLAVRAPVPVGIKVTLAVQFALAARLDPQLLASEKSPGFVPLSATPEMFIVAVPVLVAVTVWAELVVPMTWLEKDKLDGERLITGAVPVPVRVTVCGLLEALSVIVTVAARLPVAEGVNVTLIAQFAPAATDVAQVLVWLKSPLLVPVTAMLVMDSEALPLFVSVTAELALVVPTFWPAKLRLATERIANGAGGGVVTVLAPPPHEEITHTENKSPKPRAASLRRIIVPPLVRSDWSVW
jgi:hypothetical protein